MSESEITFKALLTKLIGKQDLSLFESEFALSQILHGNADAAVVGAFLSLLRAKGESPIEIAGLVQAMYKVCNTVDIPDAKLLDIVGTGGDGADTINISTASAVLAAAAGCRVAKFGNRSVSSRCGSADVLETLGISIDLSSHEVKECVQRCGVGFMFAPTHHSAVKVVAPVRKALGIRTAFNLLGPLTNPAKAQHVVIGVFDDKLVDLMANTLMEIGSVDHGVVIHGCGLDEISPLGPSTIVEIKATRSETAEKVYTSKRYHFDPLDVGIERCTVEDLRGGDPEENAQALREVLLPGTHMNAKRNAVVLNAGVGLYVYGKADSIANGIDLARTTLISGKASEKLVEWIETVQVLRSLRPSSV